jgi:hypothetical protein
VEENLQVHKIFGVLCQVPSEVEKLTVICWQGYYRDIQHGFIDRR